MAKFKKTYEAPGTGLMTLGLNIKANILATMPSAGLPKATLMQSLEASRRGSS